MSFSAQLFSLEVKLSFDIDESVQYRRKSFDIDMNLANRYISLDTLTFYKENILD
jgi:hypothetical protein